MIFFCSKWHDPRATLCAFIFSHITHQGSLYVFLPAWRSGYVIVGFGNISAHGTCFPQQTRDPWALSHPSSTADGQVVLSNWADSPECPRVRWGDDSARLVLEQRGRLEGGCRMLRKWLLFRRVPDGWEAVRSDRFAQLHLMMPKETSVPCLGTFQQTTVQPPNWGLMLCWILKAT